MNLKHFFNYHTLPMPLLDIAAHRLIRNRESDVCIMERTAIAVTEWMLDALKTICPHGMGKVLVCAGPGNSGADALLCAAHLFSKGVAVHVLMPVFPTGSIAIKALHFVRKIGVPILMEMPDDKLEYCIMVDGLFGIDLNQAIEGPFKEIVKVLTSLRSSDQLVISIDLPSGLNADTGEPIGDGVMVDADVTLSMIALKPGMFTNLGPDYSGRIFLAPLGFSNGIPNHKATNLFSEKKRSKKTTLNSPNLFLSSLPKRRASSHKGTFGDTVIIGGNTGTCGAALLSARAALYMGSGRVHAVILDKKAPAYDSMHPEIMIRSIGDFDLHRADALSIGSGMGCSKIARDLLENVIKIGKPTVLDADALNLISKSDFLVKQIARFGELFVITPHVQEAARLLNTDIYKVISNRMEAVKCLRKKLRCTVVLKGNGTIIGKVASNFLINPTGNVGLASGGTGDVLSGMISSFLAQGLLPEDASAAAVYWHGLAADKLVQRGIGPIGLNAGEIPNEARALMNKEFYKKRQV